MQLTPTQLSAAEVLAGHTATLHIGAQPGKAPWEVVATISDSPEVSRKLALELDENLKHAFPSWRGWAIRYQSTGVPRG